MDFDWVTLALQAINFLVLAWLLQHFLYRPVLAAIDRHRAETEAVRARTAEAERRAQAVEAEWRARTAAIEAERQDMRRQAEAEAARRAEEVAVAARAQADRLLAEARGTVAAERRTAAQTMAHQAAGVALALAGRLLTTAAPGVGAEPFLGLLLDRLAALPTEDRAALAGGPLRLELAPDVDSSVRETAGRRVAAALGAGSPIETAFTPALIAGARLSGPAAVLEVSWAAALAVAEREMAYHDHPD